MLPGRHARPPGALAWPLAGLAGPASTRSGQRFQTHTTHPHSHSRDMKSPLDSDWESSSQMCTLPTAVASAMVSGACAGQIRALEKQGANVPTPVDVHIPTGGGKFCTTRNNLVVLFKYAHEGVRVRRRRGGSRARVLMANCVVIRHRIGGNVNTIGWILLAASCGAQQWTSVGSQGAVN